MGRSIKIIQKTKSDILVLNNIHDDDCVTIRESRSCGDYIHIEKSNIKELVKALRELDKG